MRTLTLALALLAAGCSDSAPADPQPPPSDPDSGAVGAVAYDPAQIRVGQRALYRITRAGLAEPSYLKLQVTAADAGDTLWVEHVVPHYQRQFVVKMRIDRTGKLYEQWGGEPGSKGPAKMFPREDGRPPDPPKSPGDARADVTVVDEKIAVGGREWACKKVYTKLTYADGKSTTMITWCHPDVPFSFFVGRESYGGVVRRVYGAYTMELADHGQSGARAELEVPRK